MPPDDLVRTRGKSTQNKEEPETTVEGTPSEAVAFSENAESCTAATEGGEEAPAALSEPSTTTTATAKEHAELDVLEQRRKELLSSLEEDAKGHSNPQLRWRLVSRKKGTLLIRCATNKDYKKFGAKKPPQYVINVEGGEWGRTRSGLFAHSQSHSD